MGIRFNCTCGATYKIKDKYGGKLVRCKKCNKIAEAPTLGEQFAQQGTAVPKDQKLAAGAVPPPSFFDTAFIRPGEPAAPPEDTRPKVQTLESYDTNATVPIDRSETPKKKSDPSKRRHRSDQAAETPADEPQEQEEPVDEVDDALSALASASRSKRRGRSSRRRVRRTAVPASIPEPETIAEESDGPEKAPEPEPEPEPDLEQIAFASAKAHARRAQRRAVIYFDPVPQPNKTAEAMKKGFKKFAIIAAAQLGTFATATARAARHLFSGPDAGQINVIANIGPTRSAQAGLMVGVLFVVVCGVARAVEPASLGHLSKPLDGVTPWLIPLLLVLLPALLALSFFSAAQLLGQRPEFEEMNPAEPAPTPTEAQSPAQASSDDPDPAEPEQDVEEVDEAEAAAEAVDVEEAAEEDPGRADAEPSAPAIVMPSLGLINAKASVFVTGVALLPLIVQSLILMLFSKISAPLEAAMAVQLAVSCFLALLVYHALWGVLNLSQRWAFLATPAMLLISYSLWMMLARAMA